MTRRLLPYEHQLIEALEITEEEYLDFLQAQFDYTQTPEQKLEKPVNWETVAIVLTIVGVLFQVGAALLAPRPQIPSQKNQRGSRDQSFAPRFGFNGAQELAKYGDPVNLVYCNTDENPLGGVRVSTSLVWSAVKSFGSSQFMQALSVLCASSVPASGIDFTRIAFGQSSIKQFSAYNHWLYYRNGGIISYGDKQSVKGNDPTAKGEIALATPAYRAQISKTSYQEGFSQAFSPSSQTKFGVYAPIPVNIRIIERNDDGNEEEAQLGIVIPDIENRTGFHQYWPKELEGYPFSTRTVCPEGATFNLRIRQLNRTTDQDTRAASERRRAYASFIDTASIYKLGSAQFKIYDIDGELSYDSALVVKFECVKPGYCPSEDYQTVTSDQNLKEAKAEIKRLEGQILELELQRIKVIAEQNPKASGIGRKLQEVLELENFIDDLTDKNWTQAEIDALLENNLVSGKTLQYANALDAAREERRKYENALVDLFSVTIPERDDEHRSIANRYSISHAGGKDWKGSRDIWKEQKKSWNEAIKKRQSKLSTAFRIEGFRDGVVPSGRPGQTLRSEKRTLRNLRRKYNEEIAEALNESARINTDAVNQAYASIDQQIAQKKGIIRIYEADIKNPEKLNDFFGTKCLVKLEEARYETISATRIVEFALKARIFMRVQGRQGKYGEEKAPRFKVTDNGVKQRSAFFWFWYRKPGSAWTRGSRMFAISRGADTDSFVYVRFVAPDSSSRWEFKFEPVADINAEMSYHGVSKLAYIKNSGQEKTIEQSDGCLIRFIGEFEDPNPRLLPTRKFNDSPSGLDEWTLFSERGDTQLNFSFDNGPEIEIKAVTEQTTEAFSGYPSLYKNLCLLGFNVYSGQGIQDLRSMSAYVNKGKLVRKINDDGTITPNKLGALSENEGYPTCYAPEVFLDTALDPDNGIGAYSKLNGISLNDLAKAKRFCRVNSFYFDGVIADVTSWREFWAETAPYSLLEFARIGGKEALVPAIPCDDSGSITRAINVTAMFNAGNILEDSYKEEYIDYGSNTQDLIASVIYRDTELNGVFQRNKSVDVYLSDVVEANATRQTFDLSQFVTNRNQAIAYAKLLCRQRRHIKKSVEFRTFPTDSPLSPGAYIYVDIGQQQWQGIYSGRIEAGGALNLPVASSVPSGSYEFLIYRLSGAPAVKVTASVSSNVASSLSTYSGSLFVLGNPVKQKRVFRVTEVEIDEEGEVGVRAVEHPCDASGLSLIADFSGFTVR